MEGQVTMTAGASTVTTDLALPFHLGLPELTV
jgi:hypothetical protein